VTNSYTDAHGVYRNKLGITDAAELRRIEYDFTAHRSGEILEQNILGRPARHDLKRLQAIHRHLFQDVYEWAGKLRTVPSSKRLDSHTVSVFADPDTFAQKWQELENKNAAFVSAKSLTARQKVDALVEIFIEANHVHPFPEGNGRSLQVFMRQLAGEQGVQLDYTRTAAGEWNRASALSGTHGALFEGQYLIADPPRQEPIRKIFADMAGLPRDP
jgi:cell filamentation protein